MKRPTVLEGIGFAFLAGLFAGPLWWGLKTALPLSLAFRLTVLGSYLAYCFYLMRTTRTRVGAVSLAAFNLAAGASLALLPLSALPLVTALTFLVSANRWLLFQRSLLAMALDGLTAAAGAVFGGYLFTRTGSLPAALWGFFLVQSVFGMIAPRLSRMQDLFCAQGPAVSDPFVHGRRQAEAALERIVQDTQA